LIQAFRPINEQFHGMEYYEWVDEGELEEPELKMVFGKEYLKYVKRVPRWF